jgi:drug/metabolite transporter (DMT)-like permease
MPKSYNLPFHLGGTSSGVIAVLLWSFYAPVMAITKGLDPFLCAAVLDGVAFAVFLASQLAGGKNPFSDLRSMPAWLLIAGVVGIGGHEVVLAAAFQSAPPLEATLLNYLWPLFLIGLNAAAERKPLNASLKIAACLGFAGVIVLLSGRGLAAGGFELRIGHVWALTSALTWSVFSAAFARRCNASLFSIAFLVSASVDLVIWLVFRGAASAPIEALAIIGVASIFFASAYSLWSAGMERGDARLLSVASFLTPALASVHLAILGQVQFNAQLVVALLCILSAIAIARRGEESG